MPIFEVPLVSSRLGFAWLLLLLLLLSAMGKGSNQTRREQMRFLADMYRRRRKSSSSAKGRSFYRVELSEDDGDAADNNRPGTVTQGTPRDLKRLGLLQPEPETPIRAQRSSPHWTLGSRPERGKSPQTNDPLNWRIRETECWVCEEILYLAVQDASTIQLLFSSIDVGLNFFFFRCGSPSRG